MRQYNIAVVIGSLRRDSFNHKLVHAIMKQAPSDFSFTKSEIGDLPLYNQDEDASPSDPVKRLKSEIKAADGLLFVTPEYNRSIPGVLKNALDHASRPYGQNAWGGKPGAIIGASIGNSGTAMAQQHLRNILSYLDVQILTQPEAFIQLKDDMLDTNGHITHVDTQKFIQRWVDSFVSWVKKH